MRRDMAAHTTMIGSRLAALPKTNQGGNKKNRPTDQQSGHEPVTKLNDMIDLIAVGGSVWRLTQKLVDERKAIHTCSSPPRSAPDAARPACGHGATDESLTRQSRRCLASPHQKKTKYIKPW